MRISHSLEESELVLVHRDQHVLGLTVMIEHHLVCLTTKPRLLVAAERCMSWVCVVTIDPDATGLDGTRNLVRLVSVTSPDPSSKSVPVDQTDSNSELYLGEDIMHELGQAGRDS